MLRAYTYSQLNLSSFDSSNLAQIHCQAKYKDLFEVIADSNANEGKSNKID